MMKNKNHCFNGGVPLIANVITSSKDVKCTINQMGLDLEMTGPNDRFSWSESVKRQSHISYRKHNRYK